MYGPGKSFMALKQRHVSSTRTGPLTWRFAYQLTCYVGSRHDTYGFGGPSRFVGSHVFDCALDFDEVDVLVAEGDYAVENGLDLGVWF
jgi:hypothetical protein